MDALIQDVRYSLRMLMRRPAMSLMALALLGVGISLCTVVFSLFNAVVIRPLPIADPALGLVLESRSEYHSHIEHDEREVTHGEPANHPG